MLFQGFEYVQLDEDRVVASFGGRKVVLSAGQWNELALLGELLRQGYITLLDDYDEFADATLRFSYQGRSYSLKTHDIQTFYDSIKTYERLDVSNKDVLVVGAYVGDSPLAFVARGRKESRRSRAVALGVRGG